MSLGLNFANERDRVKTYVKLQQYHFASLVMWVPVALIIIFLSCTWSDISGQLATYDKPASQWQYCFTSAQNIYIPVNSTIQPTFNQIYASKAVFSGCVESLATTAGGPCNTTLGDVCVAGIQNDCLSSSIPAIGNPAVPQGSLLNSLSYVGIQALIFSVIGLAALNRAFRHPTWLPSTIALIVWDIFAIFTYYTGNSSIQTYFYHILSFKINFF